MAKRMLFVSLLFSLLPQAALLADPVYGTSALNELIGDRRENDSELALTGNWDSDQLEQIVSWEIVNNGNGTFTYAYTFTDFTASAISHFTLDLSDNPESDPDIVTNVSWEANGSPQPLGDVEIKDGDVDGISGAVKFDFGGFDGTSVYTFTSNRSPVYGDFFLKSGQASGQNVGFGSLISENISDYIPRPNGVAVPEPSALVFLSLIGAGICLANVGRLRRWRPNNSVAA